MKCPKCGGEMEKGLIPDRGELNMSLLPKWVTKIAIKFTWRAEPKKFVETYRCKTCGYLESYAK